MTQFAPNAGNITGDWIGNRIRVGIATGNLDEDCVTGLLVGVKHAASTNERYAEDRKVITTVKVLVRGTVVRLTLDGTETVLLDDRL
ncbi:hypothetical protein [Cellulosimicrobium aquatile]|uniref:hypothetical protein n=1 Tax=Cellulosimicrobium aquatile TaxID=1612203 RepID=UPI0014595CD5|nr:hypothetical protein [Cellulosimicrobium aquatile]NMF28893.1 hypothetical protein [Cellulosimicrobium aquatile]